MEEITNESSEETNIETESEFQFETDHLALRNNKDYSELLKCIVKLEAQKTQALKDIDELAEVKSKAIEDPLEFLQKFQEGSIIFPQRQIIANLPNIEWSKYGIDSSFEGNELGDKDNETLSDEFENDLKVRGRKFTDSKPETFNQLWSCEEQKRLEELLEIYPEEPIEASRYKKISQALGTRTPVQVMSRIQKYFAKLAKAGLPIPGRIPKGISKDIKRNVFYKKSTFFPHLQVPIKMEMSCDTESYEDTLSNLNSSNKSILEMLKLAKEQRLLDEKSPVWQINVMCVGCQKKDFIGARWTDNAGTDYCTDCFVKLLPEEKLIAIRN